MVSVWRIVVHVELRLFGAIDQKITAYDATNTCQCVKKNCVKMITVFLVCMTGQTIGTKFSSFYCIL